MTLNRAATAGLLLALAFVGRLERAERGESTLRVAQADQPETVDPEKIRQPLEPMTVVTPEEIRQRLKRQIWIHDTLVGPVHLVNANDLILGVGDDLTVNEVNVTVVAINARSIDVRASYMGVETTLRMGVDGERRP